MSGFEDCPRCEKVIMPYASEAVKQGGAVCTCHDARPLARTPPPQTATVAAPAPKTAERKAVPDLEQMFLDILAEHAPDIPKPLRQQELVPGRRFTTDFSWRECMVAVEIEGACHRTKDRFFSDAEKQCLLTVNGWKVLRFTGRMLRGRITDVVSWLREASAL